MFKLDDHILIQCLQGCYVFWIPKNLDIGVVFISLVTFLVWKSRACKLIEVCAVKLGVPNLLQCI